MAMLAAVGLLAAVAGAPVLVCGIPVRQIVIGDVPELVERGLVLPHGSGNEIWLNYTWPLRPQTNASLTALKWSFYLCEGDVLEAHARRDAMPVASEPELNVCNTEWDEGRNVIACRVTSPPPSMAQPYFVMLDAPDANDKAAQAAKFDLIFTAGPQSGADHIVPEVDEGSLDVSFEQRDDKPDAFDATVTWKATDNPTDTYTLYTDDSINLEPWEQDLTACGIQEAFTAESGSISRDGDTLTAELEDIDANGCTRITVVASRPGGYIAKYKTLNLNTCDGFATRPLAALAVLCLTLLITLR